MEHTSKVMHPEDGQISRRNIMVSAASGVFTATCLNSFLTVSGGSAGASSFQAYQVEPDSGAELNPTLIELSVSAFVQGFGWQ